MVSAATRSEISWRRVSRVDRRRLKFDRRVETREWSDVYVSGCGV